jgi:heat shock protein HslJ
MENERAFLRMLQDARAVHATHLKIVLKDGAGIEIGDWD